MTIQRDRETVIRMSGKQEDVWIWTRQWSLARSLKRMGHEALRVTLDHEGKEAAWWFELSAKLVTFRVAPPAHTRTQPAKFPRPRAAIFPPETERIDLMSSPDKSVHASPTGETMPNGNAEGRDAEGGPTATPGKEKPAGG